MGTKTFDFSGSIKLDATDAKRSVEEVRKSLNSALKSDAMDSLGKSATKLTKEMNNVSDSISVMQEKLEQSSKMVRTDAYKSLASDLADARSEADAMAKDLERSKSILESANKTGNIAWNNQDLEKMYESTKVNAQMAREEFERFRAIGDIVFGENNWEVVSNGTSEAIRKLGSTTEYAAIQLSELSQEYVNNGAAQETFANPQSIKTAQEYSNAVREYVELMDSYRSRGVLDENAIRAKEQALSEQKNTVDQLTQSMSNLSESERWQMADPAGAESATRSLDALRDKGEVLYTTFTNLAYSSKDAWQNMGQGVSGMSEEMQNTVNRIRELRSTLSSTSEKNLTDLQDSVALEREETQLMEQLRQQLRDIGMSDSLANVVVNATEMNAELSSMYSELAQVNVEMDNLKRTQVELSQLGFGLGTEPFDTNLAKMTELQERAKTLTENIAEYAQKQREATPAVIEQSQRLQEIQAHSGEINDYVKQTQADLQRVNTELSKLYARQSELQSAGRGVGYAEYDQNLSKIAELEAAQKRLNAGMSDYIAKKSEANTKSAEEIAKIAQIRLNAGEVNSEIGRTVERLKSIEYQLDILATRQRALEDADRGLGYEEYDTNLAKIAQLKAEQSDLVRGLNEYRAKQSEISRGTEEIAQKTVTWKDYVNEVKSTYKDMTNAIKKVGSFVKDTINSFKHIGNAVKNVVNRIKDMVTHTKLFNAMANHSHKPWYKTAWTIAKALIGVRGLYMLIRKLRTAIVTGFTNLTKESVQARGQLELLKAKFLQLKNSVGAAISPLVAQITPMIQRIIDLFTQAFNAVAMFFGALTGKTSVKTAKFLDSSYGVEEDKSSGGKKGETAQEKYDKAVKKAEEKYQKDLAKYNEKVAKAEQKQAEADAKLTDSKEKLNKQLQGFDELNNLTTNDLDDSADAYKDYLADIGDPPELEMPNMEDYLDAATGGGAGSKIMFEDTPIGSFFDTMADWLKNMFKLGDFSSLGKILGIQLKKLLDDIPWQKFQDWADKIGKSIATLINGFIEVDGLGYSIGRTVAEALNTIMHAIDSFVSNLHWASVGHFIADTFNGFFENIDWDLIYHTVTTGFRGLAIAINQFIRDFHWENLSTAIANLINTAVAAVYLFFSITDFDQLGLHIAEQIISSISKVDWEKVGNAAGAMLQGLLDLVLAMIHYLNEHKEEVKQAFMDFWHGLCEELDFGDVAELMLTALKIALLLKIPAIMTGIGAAILAGLKLGLGGSILQAGSIGGGFKAFLGGLFGKGAVAEATVAGTEVGTAIGNGVATGVGMSTAGIVTGIGATIAGAFKVLQVTGDKYYERNRENARPEEVEQYGKTLEQYDNEYSKSAENIMKRSDEILNEVVAGTVDHTTRYQEALRMQERANTNAAQTAEDLRLAQIELSQAYADFHEYQADYDRTPMHPASLSILEDYRLRISEAQQKVELFTQAHEDSVKSQEAANIAVDELARSYSNVSHETDDMIEAYDLLSKGEITWQECIERVNKALDTQAESVKTREQIDNAIALQKANNNLTGSYDDYNAKLREMEQVEQQRIQTAAQQQMMNNNLIGNYTQYNEKLRETATVMDELDTQLSAGGRRKPSPFDEEFMTETDEGINKLKEVPTALDEVNTALDTFSETAGTTLAESFGTLSETIVTTFSETFTTKFEEFKTTTTETLTLWVTDLQTQLSETFLTQVELLMSNIILYLQESYLTHLEEFRLLAMQMIMDMTLAMQEQWLIDQIQWDLLIFNIITTMQTALATYKPQFITDLLAFCEEILTNVMTALGCSGGGEGDKEGGGGHSTKFYDIMVQCLQGFIDAVAEKGPEALEVIGEFCGEVAGYFESIGAAATGAVESVKAAMTALASLDFGDLGASGFSISSSGGGFTFKVPGLAEGTVVPPNAQRFIAMLGDNNKEAEIVSPLSTMTQAMTQALSNAGFNSGGNGYGDIVINMDGYEVFRVVRRENEKYKMSTGMSGF